MNSKELRAKLFHSLKEQSEANNYSFYIYLTRKEWAKSWIEGGEIPLSMTTKYKTEEERSGIYTPDEDVHRNLVGISYQEFGKVFQPATPDATNIHISELSIVNDKGVSKGVQFNLQHSPALVLCLSTECSKALADRLGKEACIEVIDIKKLIGVIDKQLGVKGKAGLCHYTKSMNRNHFLKSTEDNWQYEYRVIWDFMNETVVTLPPGLCREVIL